MKWFTRTVGVLLAAVLVCVAGLWLGSSRRDAGRMRGSVEIDRPPDEVFAWISEPDKLPQWVGWLAEVHPDPATPREGIGHHETWIIDDPRMRQKLSVPRSVTVWDPPLQMGVHFEMADAAVGDV